jgi:hypothetical protein
MTDLRSDPIINVIHGGIKQPIRLLLDNECYPAAVTLIYAGIDTMAFLAMPAKQTDVTRDDFVKWSERYVHFPCQEQISGLDLYGARCSVLHAHSATSKLSREGNCRMILYGDHMVPEVVYKPGIHGGVVMVSIRGLVEAFFSGIDKFLVDLFADRERASIADHRFQNMLHTLPYDAGISH